jgi:hypothetical protein
MRNSLVPHPEPFQASITFSKKFRFQIASAGTRAWVPADVIYFLSLVGTANGASTLVAFPLIDRFRIVQIELFGPMTATLAPVTVKLEYSSAGSAQFNSASKLYSDTSMSSSSAAHIKAAPEPDSVAAMWLGNTNTQTLFNTTLPINGIMDITLEIVLNDGGTPGPVSGTAPSGGAIGTVGTQAPAGYTSLGLPNL